MGQSWRAEGGGRGRDERLTRERVDLDDGRTEVEVLEWST